MTTHPTSGSSADTVTRLRRRAWQDYLESTREIGDRYEAAEQEAWDRLQERLADIESELLLAPGTGA